MLVDGFPAGPPATNCYVVAPAAGEECVIVDPGMEALDQLDEMIAKHRLKPVAVLLTHGHIDHTFSVVPVCGARNVPAYIHPADRAQLADPWSGISARPGTPLLGRLDFAEPDDLLLLEDGVRLKLAGVELTVSLAPGHTPGSVTFLTPGPERANNDVEGPVLFSGDVLFAGSIGRTDLPGGSYEAMLDSLARVVLPLPDETIVLSGHGPSTTIGRERATNPFLAEVTPPAGRTKGM